MQREVVLADAGDMTVSDELHTIIGPSQHESLPVSPTKGKLPATSRRRLVIGILKTPLDVR